MSIYTLTVNTVRGSSSTGAWYQIAHSYSGAGYLCYPHLSPC
jgi:hypothetical protein